MTTLRTLVGLLLVAWIVTGCASTKPVRPTQAPSDSDRLRHDVTQLQSQVGHLELGLAGLESAQRELQDEVRTLTGLQQGLRQQLDALIEQSQRRAGAEEPDEK